MFLLVLIFVVKMDFFHVRPCIKTVYLSVQLLCGILQLFLGCDCNRCGMFVDKLTSIFNRKQNIFCWHCYHKTINLMHSAFMQKPSESSLILDLVSAALMQLIESLFLYVSHIILTCLNVIKNKCVSMFVSACVCRCVFDCVCVYEWVSGCVFDLLDSLI